MNDLRRKLINLVLVKLNSCAEELSSIKDNEDEARENIPENLQSYDTFIQSEECSDIIEDAILDIQGVIKNIENIT